MQKNYSADTLLIINYLFIYLQYFQIIIIQYSCTYKLTTFTYNNTPAEHTPTLKKGKKRLGKHLHRIRLQYLPSHYHRIFVLHLL